MAKSEQLEYAIRSTPGSARATIFGITALVAGAIQFPWMVFVMLMAWGDVWHISTDNASGHQDSPIYLVALLAPAVIGIVSGLYSLWIAGFGKRNVCGSLGISLFGCIILYFLVRAALDWLRANGYFGYLG